MVEETLVGPNVRLAQTLTTILDREGLSPRAVLWARPSDAGSWKLWIVPALGEDDKRDFYLRVAKTFAGHQSELVGFDIGDVQFVRADHPAISGLQEFGRIDGVNEVRFSNNLLNGYFLPDAIVVRMAT